MKRLWISDTQYVDLVERGMSLSAEIATRQRSIDFYGLGMFLPNPDPVLKKQGKDIAIYKELLVDGHLGGCVTSRKAGVKSLEWGIDRGKAKSRQARLIEEVFAALDMDRIVSEILDAPLFGYQVLEVMWEKRGDLILPKDIVGKPQSWFVFGEQNELRFRTKENWNGEPLPEKKFLLARHEATYDNPYGFPELSRCFWPVTFKRGGTKFWVIFSEKWGMPYFIGKHPRGTDRKENEDLLDMLERMIQDAVAVIPDDSSVEILEAGGKGASAQIYEKLIETCKTEVSIAILGQNLTTQVKGGSYAATESHMAVRADIVDSDRKLVEGALNELIGWIYEYNFGDGSVRPAFSMWEEEDVDSALAERDNILAQTGVKFTKTYYMKAYGLEEGDFEITETRTSEGQFAEGGQRAAVAPFPDQRAIDDFIDELDPAELQRQIEGVLKPVLELVQGSNDFAGVMEKLAEIYPDMETKNLEDMLGRAIFVSEIWGRMTEGGNMGD